MALRLAASGMDVAITYRRSSAAARRVVREIEALGRRGVAIAADLADGDAAGQVHRQFCARFDALRALVNNASLYEPGPLPDVTLGSWERHMAVNARAPLLLTRAFAPMLGADARPGHIVNFIDIHVLGQPLAGYVAYNASKAALHEITMTSAMELAPRVTVNAIAPGVVAWPPGFTADQRRAYLRRVPLGRAGTPAEAAAAVLFLVRDAGYCTGQVIRLDGGRLLT